MASYALDTDQTKTEYILKVESNAGVYGQNTREKAVDGDFSTFWETNKVNDDVFKNTFTITLNKEVTIDRLIFATRRDGAETKGFPTEATFYISNDGQSYTKIGVASCEVTNKVLLYTFAKPYSFSYFRYEFTEANAAGTKHINASEFILLKLEESEVVAVRELFIDYKKSVIKSEYANSTALTKLKSSVQDKLIYESILEPNINRAFQILAGELSFSVAKREFSVSDSATKPIRQIGSISAYRKELKHTWEGTDRQATGIFANPGEEIAIYVEADANDPLPQICFTQFISSYAGWYSTKDFLEDYTTRISLTKASQDKYRLALSEDGTWLVLEENSYLLNINVLDKLTPYLEVSYNDTAIMPDYTFAIDGYNFLSWSHNGKNYQPGEEFVVVGNYEIVAELELYKFNLVISYNGEEIYSSKKYEDQEVVNLADLSFTPSKQRLLGFSYKGHEYDLTSQIVFDARYLELTPILINTHKLQVTVGTDIIAIGDYLTGDTVNLALLKEQLDANIIGFSYGGITYDPTAEITIVNDDYNLTAILASDEVTDDDKLEEDITKPIVDNLVINKEFIIVAVVSVVVVIGLATVIVIILKKRKK